MQVIRCDRCGQIFIEGNVLSSRYDRCEWDLCDACYLEFLRNFMKDDEQVKACFVEEEDDAE